MGLAATEKELATKASRFLKAEMKRAGVTYAELARRLEGHGLRETEASIANKLARGTFAATFFLAVLAALELEGVQLGEL
jgi:urease accessory protein UreF